MMQLLRYALPLILIVLYGRFFAIQEKQFQTQYPILQPTLPVNFYRIATGYLHHFAAEALFVKTSVFLGGKPQDLPAIKYSDALGSNLDTMTSLNPRFIAPYYYCQAFLPHLAPEAAAKARTIFARGIAAMPEDLVLRFFYATNYFLAMNDPAGGAKAFADAAQLPNAPRLFGHMAAILSAEGGDIDAGLLSLHTMLKGEKDNKVRERYIEEISIFQEAIKVRDALGAYSQKLGAYPERLEQLVPEFIINLPEIKESFVLVYKPPNLHLLRPEKVNKK